MAANENDSIIPKKMDEDEVISKGFECTPDVAKAAAICVIGTGSLAAGITLFTFGKACLGGGLTFFSTAVCCLPVVNRIGPESRGEFHMSM